MLNKPLKANDIEVEIFTTGQYEDDIESYQLAVNAWLNNQPNNVYVQDIIYQHVGRNSRGKDIISMVILSTQSPK
ncbi:hypothetical protein ACFLWR_05420 [Chloroflexota bacterium]